MLKKKQSSATIKSPEEIRGRLVQLLKDDRLSQPTATLDINAPLALIQLDLEAKIETLRWVLNEGK